jgi:hypothetical protein
MTLGNMRDFGVQRLVATCLNDACRHHGLIDAAGPRSASLHSWPRRHQCAVSADGSGERLLLCWRDTTSRCTSFCAPCTSCLTPLGAICAPRLTALHSSGLGFSFFWYR